MKWSEHPNAKRWLKPPTIEQIDAVVKASGTSESQFERFYGIYPNCIAGIRYGDKRMPVQFWHLFLAEDRKSFLPNSLPISVSKTVPIAKTRKPNLSSDSRLNKLV